MLDACGRAITYLRVSVTDRCDFRCRYCMAEHMRFAPKADVLGLEELDRLCSAFVRLGVRKLRLTGGEPLVRRGVVDLIGSLARHLAEGALDELTLTTNGAQLARHAAALAARGIRRVNVSLDTLRPDVFREVTRRGELADVLGGIAAARRAGLTVKINTVVLAGINDDEIGDVLAWAHGQGMDLVLIEVMPLGEVDRWGGDRLVPLGLVRARLAARYTLVDIPFSTGGPARWVRVAETGGRLGFIAPRVHDFCRTCNRVRLTCTGRLYLCLGRENAVELAPLLRGRESDAALDAAIRAAVLRKPKGHDFAGRADAGSRPALARHMSVTGG
ncbi:GTP 3',8-cyclase MoaA [Rhodoplanes sp. TEM]|uniref:GTP 3',8-cyclase n=1 Tax=Rhodoplanes tepidamans TaxID=200616 RepID=A0ABT5J6K8_RHOTP|nr:MULTISPECIES: GTP 3',8-cyclase MoaA [Rhodoplanes]MDC7785228.1 GTP 3',8-cyclase MoaA [Rhodoplanes tepidamans]MDC7986420.1 GTP 3',8-cyclase MoaA [Rhodoplanes sp. TEM]MDQ0353486.1 cyclic pyranopterin phosphate synthase [Rhodoplanes tepidamans]